MIEICEILVSVVCWLFFNRAQLDEISIDMEKILSDPNIPFDIRVSASPEICGDEDSDHDVDDQDDNDEDEGSVVDPVTGKFFSFFIFKLFLYEDIFTTLFEFYKIEI